MLTEPDPAPSEFEILKSDGVMIRGIMLESEMSPVGSVRRTAGPVSMAAESEMFTPVFAGGGGGVVAAAVVEAVTSRVSVLPVVGSDLLTGLSMAAGVTDQLFLGSGSSLDTVGHGAGRVSVWFRWSVCRSYVKSVILCFLGCGQWPF